MPNRSGILDQADAKLLDSFLRQHNPDQCLTCPVTGERTPIVRWKVTNRLCLVPLMGVELEVGENQSPMLQITSPAGGIILLNAVTIGLVSVARVN
jgi:hypothetical protein